MAVSEQALIKRINRKLAPDLEQLRKSRGDYPPLGDFWIRDCNLVDQRLRSLGLHPLGRGRSCHAVETDHPEGLHRDGSGSLRGDPQGASG